LHGARLTDATPHPSNSGQKRLDSCGLDIYSLEVAVALEFIAAVVAQSRVIDEQF